jgi:hypothetical protein
MNVQNTRLNRTLFKHIISYLIRQDVTIALPVRNIFCIVHECHPKILQRRLFSATNDTNFALQNVLLFAAKITDKIALLGD